MARGLDVRLRGANIYQRRVYPELDGSEFMGTDPVGPPFVQADFDRLAALGANFVNISHPGLFTEDPPWVLDEDIQDNLDALLRMIAGADLFAVIAFRTGPGRSEFTFHIDDVGTWFDESYNHALWAWEPIWPAWNEEVDAFNFLHGPDPDNHGDVSSSDLIDAITDAWGRNTLRPSTLGAE